MNWQKLLKDLREKMILSQKEMSELLGISFATLNRYENGHHEPTIKVKRKIKDLCKKNEINFDSYLENRGNVSND